VPFQSVEQMRQKMIALFWIARKPLAAGRHWEACEALVCALRIISCFFIYSCRLCFMIENDVRICFSASSDPELCSAMLGIGRSQLRSFGARNLSLSAPKKGCPNAKRLLSRQSFHHPPGLPSNAENRYHQFRRSLGNRGLWRVET
jgi:hypothetical protein